MALIERGPVELTPGGWPTLERFVGKVSSTPAFFRSPAGVRIKVRYGDGSFLGFDRQKQTLDGASQKTLSVSGFVGVARMQASTDRARSLSWEIAIGGP
jgi:hypothetical protein